MNVVGSGANKWSEIMKLITLFASAILSAPAWALPPPELYYKTVRYSLKSGTRACPARITAEGHGPMVVGLVIREVGFVENMQESPLAFVQRLPERINPIRGTEYKVIRKTGIRLCGESTIPCSDGHVWDPYVQFSTEVNIAFANGATLVYFKKQSTKRIVSFWNNQEVARKTELECVYRAI